MQFIDIRNIEMVEKDVRFYLLCRWIMFVVEREVRKFFLFFTVMCTRQKTMSYFGVHTYRVPI